MGTKRTTAERGAIILWLGMMVTSCSWSAEIPGDLTRDARNLAQWVISTDNHQHLPFIIVDKQEAKVFVFRPDGKMIGAASALMGVTVGDHTAPGIGNKTLSKITIAERTTPAGRFTADLGRDLNNAEILWIDYDSGLSMHIVITAVASERRLQRLSSKDAADLRITYGCINVSSRFYKETIQPTFKNTQGIVYILPEIQSIEQVFGIEAARYFVRER